MEDIVDLHEGSEVVETGGKEQQAPPNDTCKGVLLRSGGNVPCGDYQKLVLFAYTPCRNTTMLNWELRRLVPACGFLKRKGSQLCQIVTSQRERWKQAFAAVDFELEDLFTASFRSLKYRSQAKDGFGEQEYAVTTEGMLVLLCYWGCWRRSKDAKEQSLRVLEWILKRAIPTYDAGEGIYQVRPAKEHLAKCDTCAVDGDCCHVRSFLNSNMCPSHFSHKYFAIQMASAMKNASTCLSLKYHFIDCITRAAQAIDAKVHTWGEFGWFESQDAHVLSKRGVKRRTLGGELISPSHCWTTCPDPALIPTHRPPGLAPSFPHQIWLDPSAR